MPVDDLARFQNPRAARMLIRLSRAADANGALAHRRRLVADLAGRVVEIGAGHGPNFALYPPRVAEVLAVEPEDTMRAAAVPAAKSAPVPVRVVAGHAAAIPVPDGAADAVVSSLVLCSVPDQAAALAEIVRVLRPGGELRFYEHVRSAGAVGGRVQDAVTPLWRRLAGNCHPNRDTLAAFRTAGLTLTDLDDFAFGAWPLRMRHVLGAAAKK